MAFNLGTAVARLVLDSTGLRRGIAAAQSDIGQLDKAFKGHSFGVVAASRAYTAMGAAVAAGFAVAIKAAVDWEDAMAGVQRTTQATDGYMRVISKGLRDIAAIKPVNPLDLAGVAEEAGALGIATGNVVAFTATVADLIGATELTAEEASSGLARLTGIMGNTVDEFDNVGGTILELGRRTKSTDAEILNMARRIAGVGKVVGLTTPDVLGYAAALASVGVREEQGGSAISRTFIDIQDAINEGGKTLQNFASIAGMSGEEFAAAFGDDAARATQAFIEGIGQIGDQAIPALNELGITEVRQRDAITRLAAATQNYADTQAQLGTILNIGHDAMAREGLLQQVAAQRYQTTAGQLTILRNLTMEFASTMGSALLPAVRGVVGFLQNFMNALNNMSAGGRNMIILGGALAGIMAMLGVAFFTTSIAAYHLSAAMTVAGSSAARLGAISKFLFRGTALLGLAFGGAAVYQAAFGKKTRETTDQMKVQSQVNKQLLGSMNTNRAAVEAWVNQQNRAITANKGNAEAMKRLGFNHDKLRLVIMGDTVAQQAFLEAVSRRPDDKGIQRFAGEVSKLREQFRQTAVEHQITNDANQRSVEITKDNTKATREAAKAQREAAEAAGKAWDKADAQNQAIISLIDAQFAQRAAVFAVENAEEALNDAREQAAERADDLADAEEDLADARDRITEANEKVAEAERDLAEARSKAADELADAEDDLADAQDKRLDNQDKIIDSERKLQKLQGKSQLRAIEEATRKLTRAQLDLRKSSMDVADAEFYLNYIRERGGSARDILDAEYAVDKSRSNLADQTADVAEAEEELQYQRDGAAAREVAAAERDLANARRDGQAINREIAQQEKDLAQLRADVASDKAHIEAQRELDQARRDQAGAVRDLRDAERELNDLRTTDPSRDVAEAQLALEEAYYRQAQANVEVKKQTALMRGEQWDAGRQARELAAELKTMAGTIEGEVAQSLLRASNQLAKARPLGARPEAPSGGGPDDSDLGGITAPDMGEIEMPAATTGPMDAEPFAEGFADDLLDVDWQDVLKPVAGVIAAQLIWGLAKKIVPMLFGPVIAKIGASIAAAAAGAGVLATVAAVAIVAVLIAGIIAVLIKTGLGRKIMEALVDAAKAAIGWFKENWKAVLVGALIAAIFGVPALLVGLLVAWGPEILGVLVDALKATGSFLKDKVGGFLSDALNSALDALTPDMEGGGEALIDGLWKGIENAAAVIGRFGKWAWGILVDGFKQLFGIRSPSTVFVGLGKDIVQGLWDGIVNLFEMFKRFWTTVPGKIIEVFANAGSWLFDKGKAIIQGAWDGIKDIWAKVSSWFGEIGGKVTGFFSNAGSWLFDAGKRIIDGLRDGILGAISGVANAIRRPLNWAIENVINTFIKGVRTFANAIPGVNIKLDPIGTLPVFQFHEGGLVGAKGRKGGQRRRRKGLAQDEVPAVLLRGERVLNRKETKEYDDLKKATGGFPSIPNPIAWGADKLGDLGGAVVNGAREVAARIARPIINAGLGLLNTVVKPMGWPGEFAAGMGRNLGETILDWIAGVDKPTQWDVPATTTRPSPPAGVSSIGSGWWHLLSYMNKSLIPFVKTSDYRPGDDGYHGRGKAIDLSVPGHGNQGYRNSGLRAIFDYLLSAQSSLAELILAGAPFNIKNGRRVPGYAWGQPGRPGNHWNHVHAATFDTGGTLRPGWNMVRNATGRNEQVIPTEMMFAELERILTAAVSAAVAPLADALQDGGAGSLNPAEIARYAVPVAAAATQRMAVTGAAASNVSNVRSGDAITVNAHTDADPLTIAQEIVWQKRTRLR